MQANHQAGAVPSVEGRAEREEDAPVKLAPLEPEVAADGTSTPAAPSNGHRAGASLVIDIRSGDPVVVLPDVPKEGLLAASKPQRILKRSVDILGAVVGLLVLAPLFLAIALAVKLDSRGPVLYVSDRVGKDGKPFRFLKFRTMHPEAENDKHQLSSLNEVDGPIFKIQDDPRITRVGRFLRRFSLDELPQLFHVLSGKMSLVGPRPPIPEEVAQYTDHHLRRLTVKPGLTCIWQVSGRSTVDFETWVELDLQYIENWSLAFDLVLLVRTLPAVVTGRGAY